MDKIFGGVDAVAAGEEQGAAEKIEAMAYSHREHAGGDGETGGIQTVSRSEKV